MYLCYCSLNLHVNNINLYSFHYAHKLTFDLEIEQIDVKTTFLHGDLEEETYIKQLEGFVVKGKKELVCKLNRTFMV
jgi:hypothetical protein